MSKTFLTISKKECLVVYKEILENSHKKWDAASKLAEIGEYGSATSMAIISVEELVKALILFFDGKGFEFRSVKGMNAIFRHHQIRYFIAFAMLIMSLIGDEITTFFIKMRENPKGLVTLVDKLKTIKGYLEENIKPYIEKKIEIFKEEFIWFSKVDFYRQDGFYCDYEEQLKNPIKISHDDYLGVIHRLEKVRKTGLSIIEGFDIEDEHTLNHIKNMRRDFKQKDIYQKIEKALNKVRLSKQSPFDLMKQNLIDL